MFHVYTFLLANKDISMNFYLASCLQVLYIPHATVRTFIITDPSVFTRAIFLGGCNRVSMVYHSGVSTSWYTST